LLGLLTLSNVKTVVEILAYFSAFFFFGFRVYSGYFITNLSVRIACSRQRDPADKMTDLLSVTLVLLKGDLGSVRIHDIQIRNNHCPVPELQGLDQELWRLEDEKNTAPPGEPTRVRLEWKQKTCNPFLILGPGEETQLSSYCRVSSDKVYKIEAVVAGRPVRLWPPTTCQWRISAVSLPLTS
jgi:hypothetical protein